MRHYGFREAIAEDRGNDSAAWYLARLAANVAVMLIGAAALAAVYVIAWAASGR